MARSAVIALIVMGSSSALFAATPFVSTVVEDPIEKTRTAVFAASDDGNVLSLVCEPGSGSLSIRVVPDRYFGAAPVSVTFLSGPRGDSRFSKADEPLRDMWYFDETYISLAEKFGGNERKARFLDQLARDDTFSLRYEAVPGRVETMTIEYSVDTAELAAFIGKCGPKRVIRYLQDWHSPAAPNAS